MKMNRAIRCACAIVVSAAAATASHGQVAPRRAASPAALLAYPGFYQGILPSCSFPDAWSTASQFLDYHLTLAYFLDPTKWGLGVAWLPNQMADVQGHISIVNSQVSDTAQFHVAVPTDPCAGVSDAERYDPATNPGGAARARGPGR